MKPVHGYLKRVFDLNMKNEMRNAKQCNAGGAYGCPNT